MILQTPRDNVPPKSEWNRWEGGPVSTPPGAQRIIDSIVSFVSTPPAPPQLPTFEVKVGVRLENISITVQAVDEDAAGKLALDTAENMFPEGDVTSSWVNEVQRGG
jgi:hypothetical protein